MLHAIHTDWFEKEVRARSHAMWEAEGCRDGHSEEHWMRATKDIEERCRAALEGTNPHFAPPHLTISTPPIRRVAGETCREWFDCSVAA